MTFDRKKFEQDRATNAQSAADDLRLQRTARELLGQANQHDHAYQWTWCGLPIIQMSEDMIVTQELICSVKPDVFIETGVAWGGSLAFYASVMELIGKGEVIGIDPVLPESNRQALQGFGFSKRISVLEGSSVDPRIVAQVKARVGLGRLVMVRLDGNHTHEVVLKELELYSPLVQSGSYLIVSNTIIEDIEPQSRRPRPWSKGNNPLTALKEFLKTNQRFVVDGYPNSKLLISYDRSGYLKCVR